MNDKTSSTPYSSNRRTWTKEACQIEASKFKRRWEFQKQSRNCYMAAHRHGWLDEICSHMEAVKPNSGKSRSMPYGYWTKNKCQQEANKYKFRHDFQKHSVSAYLKAQKKGWLEEICSHMESKDYGLIAGYAIYNKRLKKAYVGLTSRDFAVRALQHKHDNSTKSREIIDEIDTVFEQLTEHIYLPKDAKSLELSLYKKFQKEGYELLNAINSLGGLGGGEIKWTKKKLAAEAKKYNSISEFRKKNYNALKSAERHGLVDEICSHMTRKKPRAYWENKEICRQESSRYSSRSEFSKHNYTAYDVARINDWLDEFFQQFSGEQDKAYWQDKDRCKQEALKYDTKSSFKANSKNAFRSAIANGWIDEICMHMKVNTNRRRNYWTKDRCKSEALKYKTKSSFIKMANGAYCAARTNNWIEEICSHMTPHNKSKDHWTIENCKLEANKYDSKSDFRRYSRVAFKIAEEQGWIDEISKVFSRIDNRQRLWSFENCQTEAKKYRTKSEFKRGSSGAYEASRKNSWLNSFFE